MLSVTQNFLPREMQFLDQDIQFTYFFKSFILLVYEELAESTNLYLHERGEIVESQLKII